jgi:hypothetical protein
MSITLPFHQYHWSHLDKGAVIVVELSAAANVRLMDSSNFNAYKSGRDHRIRGGGLVKQTPFRMVVPSSGSWYVTIDLWGLNVRNVKFSVDVLPSALPTARSAQQAPLSGIRHEPPPVLTPDDDGRTWDVFISHAGEDKAAVAVPLADALRERGLEVWIDVTELRIGDSLRRRIDHGLAHSSFGVVVFSKRFFAKGWPQYELDGIVDLSVSGKQRMLPIWHEVSKDEVQRHSPSLADKIARSTSISTISEIADEIADVVNETKVAAI